MIATFFYLQINLYQVSSSIICLFGEFNSCRWISCDESEISFERLATRSTSLCSQLPLRHLSMVFQIDWFCEKFRFFQRSQSEQRFLQLFSSSSRFIDCFHLPSKTSKIYICKSNGWKIEISHLEKKKNRIESNCHNFSILLDKQETDKQLSEWCISFHNVPI